MEETKKTQISSTISNNQYENIDQIFNVQLEPVMKTTLNVLSQFGKTKKIILRAEGDSIPNAVAVANIITEKMLSGNSKVQNIKVDSEMSNKDGKMLSTIEIILLKN